MSEPTTRDPESTDPKPTVAADDADVAQLAERVDELTERVAALEARVSETPNGGPDDTDEPDPREWLDVAADHRDAAVVEALEPGETYDISALRETYRRETDIRASDTLSGRVKNLVGAEAFNRLGRNRRWRYHPPEGADRGGSR